MKDFYCLVLTVNNKLSADSLQTHERVEITSTSIEQNQSPLDLVNNESSNDSLPSAESINILENSMSPTVKSKVDEAEVYKARDKKILETEKKSNRKQKPETSVEPFTSVSSHNDIVENSKKNQSLSESLSTDHSLLEKPTIEGLVYKSQDNETLTGTTIKTASKKSISEFEEMMKIDELVNQLDVPIESNEVEIGADQPSELWMDDIIEDDAEEELREKLTREKTSKMNEQIKHCLVKETITHSQVFEYNSLQEDSGFSFNSDSNSFACSTENESRTMFGDIRESCVSIQYRKSCTTTREKIVSRITDIEDSNPAIKDSVRNPNGTSIGYQDYDESYEYTAKEVELLKFKRRKRKKQFFNVPDFLYKNVSMLPACDFPARIMAKRMTYRATDE